MGNQLVVGTTGRAALGLALVEPEPHHGCVVFLTCTEEEHHSHIHIPFTAVNRRSIISPKNIWDASLHTASASMKRKMKMENWAQKNNKDQNAFRDSKRLLDAS